MKSVPSTNSTATWLLRRRPKIIARFTSSYPACESHAPSRSLSKRGSSPSTQASSARLASTWTSTSTWARKSMAVPQPLPTPSPVLQCPPRAIARGKTRVISPAECSTAFRLSGWDRTARLFPTSSRKRPTSQAALAEPWSWLAETRRCLLWVLSSTTSRSTS